MEEEEQYSGCAAIIVTGVLEIVSKTLHGKSGIAWSMELSSIFSWLGEWVLRLEAKIEKSIHEK